MIDMLHAALQWLRDTFVFDLATLGGLLVAIWGIWQAYNQAVNARDAADAARDAVAALKEHLNVVKVVADLTYALAILEELKLLQRIERWPLLPERYSRLRTLLINIRGFYPHFTDEDHDALALATQQLDIAERRIDRELAARKVPVAKRTASYEKLYWPELNEILNDQMSRIQELLTRAMARVGEMQNGT
jgi:hypothetical protein